MRVVLTNKQTLEWNYLAWMQIEMCVERQWVRKGSKVKTARGDQTVPRGAPIRVDDAIYTLKHSYRGLSRILARTCPAAHFEFFELVAYLLPDSTVPDDLPLKHR